VDVEALWELLGEMGFDEVEGKSSLKELAAAVRSATAEENVVATPEGEHLRRWALIGAIAAAAIGAGVAWMMWKNAVNQPREPAARVIINGGML